MNVLAERKPLVVRVWERLHGPVDVTSREEHEEAAERMRELEAAARELRIRVTLERERAQRTADP